MPSHPPEPTALPTDRRLVAKATELFARAGFAGVGIRELADAAGVRSSALYHHFGTKEGLLARLIDEGQRALDAVVDQALATREDPLDRLAVLVQAHVVSHAAFPTRSTVIDQEVRNLGPDDAAAAIARRDAYEARWAAAIDRAAEAGAIAVTDPAVTRLALLQMCTGVCAWFRADGPSDVFAVAARHVDLALGLLRAQRDGRPATADDVALLPAAFFTATPAWQAREEA